MNAPTKLEGNGAGMFVSGKVTITIPATSAGEAPGTIFATNAISGYKPISILSIGLSNAGNKMAFISWLIDPSASKIGVNYKNIATTSQSSFTCNVNVLYVKSELF